MAPLLAADPATATSPPLQEEASARAEQERLRVEQQIQAERRAAEQYAVRRRGVREEEGEGEGEGEGEEEEALGEEEGEEGRRIGTGAGRWGAARREAGKREAGRTAARGVGVGRAVAGPCQWECEWEWG